jgi:DNA repair protein RecN (Recombination protein N)
VISAIQIQNFALIEEMSLNFQGGLSVITGETGAGKSIVLDAISLGFGKRADLSVLTDESKKCVIEINVQVNAGHKSWFDLNDIDYFEDTLIRRELNPNGRSRAFINDCPVRLEVLSELAKMLIDIHAQHDTFYLLQEKEQLNLLDSISAHQNLMDHYQSNYNAYKQCEKEIAELEHQHSAAQQNKELNDFLLQELQSVQLEGIVLEDLEEEQKILSSAEFLLTQIQHINQLFGDENNGIEVLLDESLRTLQKMSSTSTALENLYERLHSIRLESLDFQESLNQEAERIVVDPRRLQIVDELLASYEGLFRKHQCNALEELIQKRDELLAFSSSQQSFDEKIANLNQRLEKLSASLQKEGKEIHKNRLKASLALQNAIATHLSALGMPHSNFVIELQELEHFQFNGMSSVDFKFSANKGMPVTSLKKVASGGELSRIMLAIKYESSQYLELPTVIFDEIDTGVSGNIADKMANMMSLMAARTQVLAVTHLPQVASKGDYHIKIDKQTTSDKTFTKVFYLSNEERINEVANMIAGEKPNSTAIEHAKTLLGY